jgi:hypothetical protein
MTGFLYLLVIPQLRVIIGYGVILFSRSVGIYCRRTPPSINEGAAIIIKIPPVTEGLHLLFIFSLLKVIFMLWKHKQNWLMIE